MTAIYNAHRKFKLKELYGRSQMQQLLSKLAGYNYVEWHRINDDTSSVRDLFWARPLAIELLRAFPRVLIMDCTYKTNKYRFLLLEIVGVTSTELIFSVAFMFLENERVDNYTWVLEKLKTVMDENMLPSVILIDKEIALMNVIQNVFPNASNLLYRWHISRNVPAYCKKLFETNEKWETVICSWNVLVLSSTKQEYINNLSLMEREFSNYSIALDYVKQTWLDKYKEKFTAAWTDLVMHLGNSTTNRAESSYSQLKRQLGSSQGNFLTSWTKIHGLLQLQHNEIKASFERSLTLVQHSFKPSDFKELRGFVSRNALNMVLDEYGRVDSNDSICSCVVRLTHWLSCAHEISGHKQEGQPIPLSSIHPHWRKLDFVPTTDNESPKLNCKVEVEMIEKRFNKIDDGSKL
ncbi:hypothetical protein Dsin_018940 [Dipteronia sinensis]|uniref:MULE transposase domain-containing protein n=1 Tax=Dipteronia sinensis TaxID=43782 RepID=A0AAE0A742_9ROSI|nr:hypothetical protein Dsin_018940 [Dipteronia sinensis]